MPMSVYSKIRQSICNICCPSALNTWIFTHCPFLLHRQNLALPIPRISTTYAHFRFNFIVGRDTGTAFALSVPRNNTTYEQLKISVQRLSVTQIKLFHRPYHIFCSEDEKSYHACPKHSLPVSTVCLLPSRVLQTHLGWTAERSSHSEFYPV